MSDLIDRQTAIDTAIEAADDWDGGYNLTRGNMIEEAIKKLTSVTPKLPECGDAVSRESVLSALREEDRGGYIDYATEYVLGVIRRLPPVTPVKGYCRDCYHFTYDHASDCTVCFKDDYAPMEPDDYCSKWEKKDE